jgi:hypothetical protein
VTFFSKLSLIKIGYLYDAGAVFAGLPQGGLIVKKVN